MNVKLRTTLKQRVRLRAKFKRKDGNYCSDLKREG